MEWAPILTLQVAAPAIANDFGKSHQLRDRWRDIDMPRRDPMPPALYPRSRKDQRRARLHHVERAMLPRLDAIGVGLGTYHDVRRARAVEKLRDTLIGEWMRHEMRL